MTSVRAAVLTGPSHVQIEEFPLPQTGADDAIVRIEACGLCGSDVAQVRGGTGNLSLPIVPGHEPLGIVETIGERAARRWGVQAGDRVCVEVVVPCRNCDQCAAGVFTSCRDSLGAVGFRPIADAGPLIGGFAERMYVHPNAVVHRMDRGVPVGVAAMFNTVAAGIRWAGHLGGVGPGDTVAVFGAGQRGIAAVIAAKAAGAESVIATGLTRDAHKLALAAEFGADTTINAETEDVAERVREATGGRLADVVLDLTPGAAQPVRDALECARAGGTVVLAGLKHHHPVELDTDQIVGKGLRVVGARGVESGSIREAIALIESRGYPLGKLSTHTFGLDGVLEAVGVLSGEVEGEDAVCVAIVPR